jgi:hypothetical protein
MENEERKIAKVYAFVCLYTISLLINDVRKGKCRNRQMSNQFQYLHPWSERMHGAMQLLRKLQDEKVNLLPCMGKDSRIYSDALYKTLSDLKGMQDFLEGKELRFKDHQMNKKGKLSSCVAYFV